MKRLWWGLCLFVWMLQGCSLLFVVKGQSSFVAAPVQEIPHAQSLEKVMNRPDVIRHRIIAGETLGFLGKAFFGQRKRGAVQIAKANHLKLDTSLKADQILKIINPIYFPSVNELKIQLKMQTRPISEIKKHHLKLKEPVFSTLDADLIKKSIFKIQRPKMNKAFASGERLVYQVKVLSVIAGEASLEVGPIMTIDHRPCYTLVARAKSAFPFTAFYPVRDLQTSYFDAVDFLPWKFENNVSEGHYKSWNLELYHQVKHRLWHRHNANPPEELDIPPFTQDVISCFYYFRLLPIKTGKSYLIPTSSLGKNYHLVISVIRREKITIPLGTFDCYLVKPYVQHDTVFRNSDDIDIWVTADSRHIPILIKSGIIVGSMSMTLLQETLPRI